MHELSLVLSIVDMAEREARQARAARIQAIELEIGRLSTVEPIAFDTAWQLGVQHTLLEGAERSVRYTAGEARCRDCGRVFSVENLYDPCPACGSFNAQVTAGQALRVVSITIT
jgi:hydrogenase nickel incorporation protein HypA/HybF